MEVNAVTLAFNTLQRLPILPKGRAKPRYRRARLCAMRLPQSLSYSLWLAQLQHTSLSGVPRTRQARSASTSRHLFPSPRIIFLGISDGSLSSNLFSEVIRQSLTWLHYIKQPLPLPPHCWISPSIAISHTIYCCDFVFVPSLECWLLKGLDFILIIVISPGIIVEWINDPILVYSAAITKYYRLVA